jgi:hypothetical protein
LLPRHHIWWNLAGCTQYVDHLFSPSILWIIFLIIFALWTKFRQLLPDEKINYKRFMKNIFTPAAGAASETPNPR